MEQQDSKNHEDIDADDTAKALDVPAPDELVDELVHRRHRRRNRSRITRILTHIFFYACFFAVAIYASKWTFLWCTAYHTEHEQLKAQVAKNAQDKKRVQDIEKTLKISYEFLSKYEAHYYAILYNDFAKAYDLPWEIYAALVRIESNFDPSQKSSMNAKGMTQVIESTGRSVAAQLGLRYKEGETLWNDLLNMVIGFSYFSEGYRSRLNEGATRDEAIRHAIKRYLGGSSYSKSSKETRIYVSEYNVTVWQEYKKLCYIFRGVCADTISIIAESPIDTLDFEQDQGG
jgi:soluble lytic murein transglycosylase